MSRRNDEPRGTQLPGDVKTWSHEPPLLYRSAAAIDDLATRRARREAAEIIEALRTVLDLLDTGDIELDRAAANLHLLDRAAANLHLLGGRLGTLALTGRLAA